MSYAPKPAGHDDAPLEQRTSVECAPQINLLRRVLEVIAHPDFLRTGISRHDWMGYITELISQRDVWSYDVVRSVFLDGRMQRSLEKIREQNPGFPSWLYTKMLDTSAAKVLEFGGLYPNIRREYLSSLNDKVLLFDASMGTDDFPRSSNKPPLSLLIINEASSRIDPAEKSMLFDSAVVVDFSAVPNPWVCCSAYIVPKRKPAALIDTKRPLVLATDEHVVHMTSGNIPFSPSLRTYVDELLGYCRHEPHSVHKRYGPTPGQTILGDICVHLTNTSAGGTLR